MSCWNRMSPILEWSGESNTVTKQEAYLNDIYYCTVRTSEKRGNLLQIFLRSPAVRMFLNFRMDRPVLSSQMMKRGIFTIFHFYPFLHTQGFTVSVAIFHFSLSYRYLTSKVWSGQFLGLLVTVYFSKYSIPLKISLFRNMFSSAAVCGIQFPAVSFTRHRFFI